ncbi:MAG: HipA domain-containing protein [Gammaproteobacteria bacterium]
MSLHLVGETLDKTRSHYLAERGKLVQLMRGIYVNADDDIDATVLRHAVRIAKYLYPNAYLSAASAVLLAPSPDGRLFLSARRKQRTRIRALEIIQNEAPKIPSLSDAIIDDGMGEFHTHVSSIRQRFLEAFRLRSEHASSIDDDMRTAIAARLIEEYGSPQNAADAVWALARQNEWYREGELAERHLLRKTVGAPISNLAQLNLTVAWHGKAIGHLLHDGFEWRWNPLKKAGPPLIRQTTPGKLPPFILSLLPEGWLDSILKDTDERGTLRSGKRYMSNIAIVERAKDILTLPSDVLMTKLETYSKDGVFTGTYKGPGRKNIEDSFEDNLAQIYTHAETPRLSGVQIKAPMYLDSDGSLLPSTDKPFTHILKPAGTSGFQALPIIEYVAMALGRACQFEVPFVALVPMPDGMSPALVVERFDIRQSFGDRRCMAMEDLCSVLDLPVKAKYDGTLEKIARSIRSLSTDPNEDLILILKRQLFAWFIADGDMHLKNLALLKIAELGDRQFRSVRVAPLYDSVTTRVFPGLKKDRLAIKINGKDDRLQYRDFIDFATTAGIKSSEADSAITQILDALRTGIDRFSLPHALMFGDTEQQMVTQMLDICRSRIRAFAIPSTKAN